MGSRVPVDRGPDGRPSVGVGGLLSVPLGGRLRRLSVQVAGDFVDLEDRTFEDPVFGHARDRTSLAIFNPRLGVAIADTARFGLDLHVGHATLLSRTTFALERTPDPPVYDPWSGAVIASGGDRFENVCDLTFFADRCTSSLAGAGSIGIGARILRTRNGSFFFGADYAWHTNGRHLIVGTIGLMVRRQL